jgi:hypothetical protein
MKLSWWVPAVTALALVCSSAQAAKPAPRAAKPDAALISGLAAEDFATREKAEADLWQWAVANPKNAGKWLWELSLSDPDPEVRDRCLSLLRRQVLAERDSQGSGFIGISMQAERVTPPGGEEQSAVRVIDLIPLSGAVNSGLKIGDLILKFEGEKLTGQVPNGFQDQEEAVGNRLGASVRQRKPGETITLTVLRGDKQLDLKVVLGLHRPSLGNGMFDPSSFEERMRREDDLYFDAWLEAKRSKKE